MISDFLTGNIIYSKYIDRWRFLYNSYIGGQEYRDAGYLTRYQLETDSEYRARCLETPLDNHCKSIVHIYNSFLFKKCPERDFGELSDMPDIESFLKDADLDGQSLDNFMKQVSIWSQVFGHCWVILTKPNIDAQSLAEEQLLGIRPYANLLTPLTVLDWGWSRALNGKYELSYFKYIEDINGSEHVIKEWTQDEIKTTVYDAQNRTTINESIMPNGIGIIPAIISYSSRSITRGIGTSAIDDISDMQRYEYNALSEAAQSIRLDSHPSLVATEDTQISTGAGSIIQIPDNIPGELKPYILDFNGASIQSITALIDKTVSAIDKAANIEGIRSKETRTLSGVALETEFQTLNAVLSDIASNLQDAEQKLWELFCLYQLYPMDSVNICYPSSFDIKDDDRDIDQLVKAKSAATDPAVLQAIDLEVLDWLEIDPELVNFNTDIQTEEFGQDITTVPTTMAEVMDELISEGMVNGCPIVMIDKQMNIDNHISTIQEANLGPASPNQPENPFWTQKAYTWGVSQDVARQRLCSNCGFYLNTQNIKDCFDIAKQNGTLPLATDVNPTWENTTDAAAYCLKYDITCTASRTCDNWIAGGPLTEQNLKG